MVYPNVLMSLTQVFGMRPNRLNLIASAIRISGLCNNKTLLEVGCGDGRVSIFLSQEFGCKVIGIDSSERMIASATKRAEAEKLAHQAKFFVADAVDLPFSNSIFDAVICEAVFSALEDKEKAAKEFMRVLKSGGKLLIIDFVLRREIAKELQSQMSFFPCLARTKLLEEYIRLFERVGFQNPYAEDHSEEVRKIGRWIAYSYGSWDKLFASLSLQSDSCSKKPKDLTSLLKACQAFYNEAELGYALMVLNKP